MGLVWGASGECVEVESGVGCVEQNLRCSVLLFSVCLLLLFGSFGFLSPDRPGLPGAARQPLTFLAPPRKVSKRRRPLGRSPFGVPGAGRHKSGRENNSLRSDIFPFFFRFAPAVTGYSQADFEPARFALPGMARLRHCAFKVFLCHQLVRRFSKHHPQRYNASCFRCALLIACGGYPNTRKNARRMRSGSSKPTARAMFSNDSSPASTRGRAASARSFSIALAGVCPVSALKARSNWRRLRQAISARRSALSDSCKWLRA